MSLAKNTSHWIFFSIIVQPLVLFKPVVLERTFLFTINGFRELKCLRWLVLVKLFSGFFSSFCDLFWQRFPSYIPLKASLSFVDSKNHKSLNLLQHHSPNHGYFSNHWCWKELFFFFFFYQGGTFLFTINGFKELKRLRWMVWLKILDYFRHGVTFDLFNRMMVILLLLPWLLLRLLQLVTWFEKNNNFFLFRLDIFSYLPKTTKN